MITKVVEINIQGDVKKKDNIQLSRDDIYYTLTELDKSYSEKMSSHMDLKTYSEKLYFNSNFVVCRGKNNIIGIIAYYANLIEKKAYIPYVCVSVNSRGEGVASKMMQAVINEVANYCDSIELEVRNTNFKAILLYKKYGFIENGLRGAKINMIRRQK
jgi:ribosomal protein S18 acetylase RimI-like enzyme